ncbi:MAG: hypothetical protein AUI16_08925 [Alphaproteobacteria bacterium 13_2_20CM_2_64_7]|nr:MAG: hypothetical protein AUI16_08925 [Alphaproteobacteria bacterium 13_2_20CM_2_64_7]
MLGLADDAGLRLVDESEGSDHCRMLLALERRQERQRRRQRPGIAAGLTQIAFGDAAHDWPTTGPQPSGFFRLLSPVFR